MLCGSLKVRSTTLAYILNTMAALEVKVALASEVGQRWLCGQQGVEVGSGQIRLGGRSAIQSTVGQWVTSVFYAVLTQTLKEEEDRLHGEEQERPLCCQERGCCIFWRRQSCDQ